MLFKPSGDDCDMMPPSQTLIRCGQSKTYFREVLNVAALQWVYEIYTNGF